MDKGILLWNMQIFSLEKRRGVLLHREAVEAASGGGAPKLYHTT